MSNGIASVGVSVWFYKHEGVAQWNVIKQAVENPDGTYSVQTPPVANNDGWNKFSELIDLSLSGPDATVINLTHLGSPAYFKEKKRGFRDGGALTLTCNYIDVSYARFLYLFKDFWRATEEATCYQTDLRWWEIRIPDEACGGAFNRISFPGFLKTGGLEVPEDDRVTQDIEIELSGFPVITDVLGNVVTPVPGHLP